MTDLIQEEKLLCSKQAMPNSILVFHPGHVLVSYNTALALQNSELLLRFETGIYFKKSYITRRVLEMLPTSVSQRLLKQLMRRSYKGLNHEFVRTHFFIELVYLISVRLPFFSGFAHPLMTWRNRTLARRAGSSAVRENARVVVGYDSCALEAFSAAKPAGVVCVLEQVVGSWSAGRKVLEKEKHCNPDFSSTIKEFQDSDLIMQTQLEAKIADKIVVASDYVRETLIEDGVAPEKIKVIPYGVDTEYFTPSYQEKNRGIFTVLFVGQLTQRKGIKYLLEAMVGIDEKNIQLVLLGSVNGNEEVLHPYKNYFSHIKNVPYSELPKYYQSADVFVYPSLHEGSALVIYEALACGLPVITTFNSGSVVRDGIEGYLIPIQDAEAISKRIVQLYHDTSLCRSMSHSARKRAEEFSWAHYRRNIAEFYEDIANESMS